MKTLLIVIGKTTDARIESLTNEYVARIRHYAPFEIVVVPELRGTKSLTEAQQQAAEAESLKRLFEAGDYIVLLDEHGRERRSKDFASWVERRMSAAPRRLVFVVGGPYGFAPEIHKMAHEEISLSLMTFSHQMVRLVFAEQLYRAHTILRGEPYHHE